MGVLRMSLQGELCDMPFEDLFHVLTENNKQGVLLLESGNYRGQLFVWNGEPYSATVVKVSGPREETWLRGEDAVHYISTWQQGNFQFKYEQNPSTTRNIFINKRELMLANIFKQDTFTQLPSNQLPSNQLPSNQLPSNIKTNPINPTNTRTSPKPTTTSPYVGDKGVVRPTADYHSKIRHLELTVTEWAVLIQLTGTTKVQEIAQEARLSLEAVQAVLEKMVRLGVVEFSSPVSATSSSNRRLVGTGALADRPTRSSVSDVRQVLATKTQSYPTPSPAFVGVPAGVGFNSANPKRWSNPNSNQPKRGLLSSLMAKIRGL
jgi:hypothetical protein